MMTRMIFVAAAIAASTLALSTGGAHADSLDIHQATLAEANQKRAAFLRQAAIELRLSNVEVHEGRVEAWRPQPLFDAVISRAFAALADFIVACRHLLAPAGALAAMTGAAPTTLSKECRLIPLRVPLLDAQRHLVLCPASSL